MRTVAIIQARMGSTRLPGKTLMDLAGEPVVDHVIRRVRRTNRIDHLILAIPDSAEDDVLAEHLKDTGVDCVRGDADDVLSRYHLAAEAAAADVIVRITADCPLIDPNVIDEVVESFYQSPQVDYCSNSLRRTYPIGMDTEAFTRTALDVAYDEATSQQHREHVTPFIYQSPDRFRLRNVTAPSWAVRPNLRLTIDEPADLRLAEELYVRCGSDADLRTLIEEIDRHPEIAAMNETVPHRHVEKPKFW